MEIDKVEVDKIERGKIHRDKKEKWWRKKKNVEEEKPEVVDYSEALRKLINSIGRCVSDGKNCLAVTSYIEKQGKTSIIKMLGKDLAKAGYKTLIVDGNIPSPTLSTIEDVRQAKGLLDFINIEKDESRQLSYSEVIPYIRSFETEDLYIIPRNQNVSPGYNAYIKKEEVEAVFKILKDKFDVILVEAPSFKNLSYAQSILEASDGYFMVIKEGELGKKDVREIKEKMKQVNSTNVGAILNKRNKL